MQVADFLSYTSAQYHLCCHVPAPPLLLARVNSPLPRRLPAHLRAAANQPVGEEGDAVHDAHPQEQRLLAGQGGRQAQLQRLVPHLERWLRVGWGGGGGPFIVTVGEGSWSLVLALSTGREQMCRLAQPYSCVMPASQLPLESYLSVPPT